MKKVNVYTAADGKLYRTELFEDPKEAAHFKKEVAIDGIYTTKKPATKKPKLRHYQQEMMNSINPPETAQLDLDQSSAQNPMIKPEPAANEIRIAKNGNMTIVGGHAHTLYFKMRDDLLKLHDPIDSTAFCFVLEIDGTMRAAQSSIDGALEYMKPDRILIIKDRN